jgi:hypothetical protein
VARTNKHTEEQVRKDTERMNAMLSDEIKGQGIRYIFAIGSIAGTTIKQRSKKDNKKEEISSIL